jgi:hypothetical protein
MKQILQSFLSAPLLKASHYHPQNILPLTQLLVSQGGGDPMVEDVGYK